LSESQNIYDDPAFFAGYKKLREGPASLNEVLEQPALWSLVGESLEGLTVLDLGCGFGDFARRARRAGAKSVLGIDISENMLAEARRRTNDTGVEFRCADIAHLVLQNSGFDVVVSSLMLHYVEDYEVAVGKIAGYLRPGGKFVFSVEHPIFTARVGENWIRDIDGSPLHWPLDHYRNEGERRTTWFIDGVVRYHRSMETYVNGLIDAGFELRRLLEPAPAMDAAAPVDLDLQRRRPPFLLISATRAPG